ncbi:dihydropteroate synthase [Paramylibacter ulvae]|nr:dihydropteroate synthase [Amylibacter ulvae]
MQYFRPIAQTDAMRPRDALSLAGGAVWFTHCEVLSRGHTSQIIPVSELPDDVKSHLSSPRAPIAGVAMDKPAIMGVLNVTPDSFSDGGQHNDRLGAISRAMQMIGQGADIIDVGGESTRPGADFVDNSEEINRTIPVIAGLKLAKIPAPISIDTRKAEVAKAAIDAGAELFNDVTALSFDPDSITLAGTKKPFVCLMHASGDPKTMQDNPQYDNVLLDVYDYLSTRVDACVAAGVPRKNIIVDPGIGFGKTRAHNIALIKGLSLFHGLGCPVLLGVSRKRFIGEITGEQDAAKRAVGSVAVALNGLSQGVQIIRCHDVTEHKQAFDMWSAMNQGSNT